MPDAPKFAGRPTVRLDQGMPEKGSVIGLSDSAFRLMVEAICYCGRNETDGLIPKPIMRRMATKATAPKELEKAGHVEDAGDAWRLVDYLQWNRSHSEIESFRESRAERGGKGGHARWHVPNRKKVQGCEYCYPVKAVRDVS